MDPSISSSLSNTAIYSHVPLQTCPQRSNKKINPNPLRCRGFFSGGETIPKGFFVNEPLVNNTSYGKFIGKVHDGKYSCNFRSISVWWLRYLENSAFPFSSNGQIYDWGSNKLKTTLSPTIMEHHHFGDKPHSASRALFSIEPWFWLWMTFHKILWPDSYFMTFWKLSLYTI